VPLCIERGINLIVGILGILKAGGAYVPIDVEYPAERIKFMLQDISATVVLTSGESRRKLSELKNVELLEIDRGWVDSNSESNPDFKSTASSSSLAYIIYTSGSTGKPKGVMVEHGNVVSLVKDVSYVSLTNKDILLSTGSPSFDATTFEYWGMLLNGGTLVLCAEETLLNIALLKEEIVNRKVTKMWFTSSWFNQLVETDITVFSGLQTILVGGEKLSETHIKKVGDKFPSLEIKNGYGPTENTTFSLTCTVEIEELGSSIPVGRPLNNRTAYIVDKQGQLVPIGVQGEIMLGGAGLARGYLNRPELTADKFLKNPFSLDKSARLYRTGDLGRWFPDGNIEYLGRIDDQVKIRGYRIELGK
jgi:amino acid adenylation domain-containing protein